MTLSPKAKANIHHKAHTGLRIYHYHTDHLGTPQELTNARGEVVWLNYQMAWGGSFSQLNHVHNLDGLDVSADELQPFRFQRQFYDSETGLHYNRFRYYDSDVGMFISRDPIELLGGFNVFAYAPNPVMWIDPWGLSADYEGLVYRGMKVDATGNPIVHSGENAEGKNAANSLGVRTNENGMSAATTANDLPSHRRPRDFGGTMTNANVFSIHTDDLKDVGLKAINDHDNHISIEPKELGTSRDQFIESLNKTKEKWTKCTN